MTTIRSIDPTAATAAGGGVSANAGGGGGTGGIFWVGLASAGDGARRISPGRLGERDRRGARSWSVGGSGRPADGSRCVVGPVVAHPGRANQADRGVAAGSRARLCPIPLR